MPRMHSLILLRIGLCASYLCLSVGIISLPSHQIILLADKEELIHKAVGWMLREAGKMNSVALIRFLQENYSNLPRVTLRYAIEKFSPTDRRFFLKGIFSLRD
jgi:hypothetical protein